mmetsp:Transcript_58925/g.138559  ORF Transcript_58925/g.138559 Transcript_58925/m.138559 type:complete len:202 (-) Transcript_58925:547-1152(-)
MMSSTPLVNLNGSRDPFYRYKMPCAEVCKEGSKTVFVNILQVCKAVGRPPEYLIKALQQELKCAVWLVQGRASLPRSIDSEMVQRVVFSLLADIVLCPSCGNPETTVHTEGNKKRKEAFLSCRGCGRQSSLDAEKKIVKFVIDHPPSDADIAEFGTKGTAAALQGSVVDGVTALADAAAAQTDGAEEEEDEEWPDDDWDEV